VNLTSRRAVFGALAAVVAAHICVSAQVPYTRILRADTEPQNWLTYSGSYRSHRHSALTQITRQNVAQLKMKWVYQIGRAGLIESSPIVVDGIIYLTEPPSIVTALDARTGRQLWTWAPAIPPDVRTPGSAGAVNRGVAVLGDSVFVGTVHGHLVALDARSGAVRWDAVVGDNQLSYFLTLAPLAIDGRIIVGVSGAEAGIRGYIDAYDARTGARLWRTYTVPAPGEPGSETWTGDAWKTGGGSTWVTGSFDPDLNLVYWGTGNPGPDFNGDVRPGDNLYTASLLALDAATGKIRWHFQFTPHDTHDWDSAHVPVLLDVSIGGRARKVVAVANRNGFYYVLDRATGEFLVGTPYAKQTWAEGLDPKGRPIVKPGTDPSVEGTLVYPGLVGGANWYSPTYSPQTNLFYQSVKELGSVYFKGDAKYEAGRGFSGGGTRLLTDDSYGAIRALEATTGKLRWEYTVPTPTWSSLLSTAGGLVFGGDAEGNFVGLDAESGKRLWDVQLGGPVRGGQPISFAVDGKQYVSVAAGAGFFVFGLP
jgi:alcohol dehydrogenase (cytochrome c)